ncbi:MAG TPA: HEAT repeat domain-containing protein [Woeseiaceae bacterium]|nr:HEAT repeat domain-containing protein [Woeseiaceae bacterium]
MASKKRNDRPARCVLAALLASVAAADLARGAAAAGLPIVTCEAGVVETPAGTAARETLAVAIAAACGLRLVRHADVPGTITMTGRPLPRSNAIERVLAGTSYQLHLPAAAGDGRGTLWIFGRGDAIPADAALLFETTLLQGEFGHRRDAVRQLRRIANDDAVRLLSLALADPDARIRDATEEALAAIGSDEALAALASAAAHGDAASRADALVALSTADGLVPPGLLAKALADPDPRVRATTVHALGNVDAPGSRQLLRRALEDPEETVREAALDVLAELDDDAAFHALFPAD